MTHAAPDDRAAAGGRAIVLFADGTGNAFTKRQSNVWRLYDALDTINAAQIACYVPGVGTSMFPPLAMIDGATGLGVPSNVRRLYDFLAWNYRPGDRIYMFGFSRGAFTIRWLIAMIESQGLLSHVGTRGSVSLRERRRNAASLWRAHQARRRRGWREGPTIKIVRTLRDAVLWLRDRVNGYEPYRSVRARSDMDVRIDFVGLFDTVEAFGVPIEELRDAIDWAIWPIRFTSRELSAKVVRACHALSIDDERHTFHPFRFDRTSEENRRRIEEVWFAGGHSDVGGGYPDDAAALVPLKWMLDRLEGELVFKPEALDALRRSVSSLSRTHDSRTGFGALYRYFPRVIGLDAASGGPPVVHHSVIEKLVFGSTPYAPRALPAALDVLMPDGRRLTIDGFAPNAAVFQHSSAFAAPEGLVENKLMAERAFHMLSLNEAYVSLVHDAMWLRRKVFFLTLLSFVACLSLPLTSTTLPVTQREVSEYTLSISRVAVLKSFLADLAMPIVEFTPGFVQPWIMAVAEQPLLSITLIMTTVALYRANGMLRDTIEEGARHAWFGSSSFNPQARGPILRATRWLRSKHLSSDARGTFYWLWFTLNIAVLLSGAVYVIDRMSLADTIQRGNFCRLDMQQRPRPVNVGAPEVAEGFAISNPCWDTGLFLDKGGEYTITLDMAQPFLDGDVVADIGGFDRDSIVGWLGAPLRRWISAPYFQPVARIGSMGMTEWLLRPDKDSAPRKLGANATVSVASQSDRCAPVQARPEDVAVVARKLQLKTRQTSHFVAPESGELFVYLNDVVVGTRFLAVLLSIDGGACFYRDNSGMGRVTVERFGAGRE